MFSLSDQSKAATAGREWLELIFHERFGHPLKLQVNPDGHLCLALAESKKGIIFDRPISEFLSRKTKIPYTQWDPVKEGWSAPTGAPLPMPGIGSPPSPLMEDEDRGILLHYDIPGLIYWALNRLEEVDADTLDSHQRFPATASHAYQYDYLDRPFIDEWLDVIRQVLARQYPLLDLRTPHFKLQVSHDVDCFSRYRFSSVRSFINTIGEDVLHERSLRAALQGMKIRYSRDNSVLEIDPYNTFDWLMDVSERNGTKSAFYLICGATEPALDADYSLGTPEIISLIQRIFERGHEIGLHPSYGTYQSPELILAEAESLRQTCMNLGVTQKQWGGRMHYLRWEHPTTLLALESAGQSYDGSMGYADIPGFRSGTCFEYPAFDFVDSRILKLRIRPLVVMEATILASRYLNLGTSNRAYEKLLGLRETCKKVNGTFSILWHNSNLARTEQRNLYQAIIQG